MIEPVEIPHRAPVSTSSTNLVRRSCGLRGSAGVATLGRVNLHDWIDELCDTFDVDAEVDEGLLTDLAQVAREQVDRGAGPVTTYLLGYAAGAGDASPATVEQLAARAQQLAEAWDQPAGGPTRRDDEVEDDVLDDEALEAGAS